MTAGGDDGPDPLDRRGADGADEAAAAGAEVGRALAEVVEERGEAPRALARLTGALAGSARAAGGGAVASGRWLASLLIEVAPRIPIRDLATLQAHHEGKTGAELAEELIRGASRASAAVGVASGAVVSAHYLAPPSLLAVPFELVTETLAIAAIEIKLIAELHAAFGQPVTGPPADQAAVLVRAWAERRGVTLATVSRKGGLADALGRGTRNELIRIVRKRIVRRLGRNLSTLAPMLVGAAAGAEVNRRATRALGDAVVRDLVPPPAGGQRADGGIGLQV